MHCFWMAFCFPQPAHRCLIHTSCVDEVYSDIKCLSAAGIHIYAIINEPKLISHQNGQTSLNTVPLSSMFGFKNHIISKQESV